MDKDFLLRTYGSLYGPEAGPWNLSAEQKYLEYRATAFFEENFPVAEGEDICNVGIGAGYWDRYLSYRLQGGGLVSIDLDPQICRALEEGLRNEGNPAPVRVICKDVMECEGLEGRFGIVTMTGSTRMESGLFESILEKLFTFLKPGGSLFYQSLDPREEAAAVEALCQGQGFRVEKYLLDTRYGRKAQYWKITACGLAFQRPQPA